MDYMREIKAFYDWLETNPLATSGIALWHALMSIANKARWPDKFAVATSVLQGKTGLKRDAIYDARNLLQQQGLVVWKSRSGNQSAEYTLLSCVGLTDAQTHTPAHTVTHTNPTHEPTQDATQNPLLSSYSTSTQKTKTKTNTNTLRDPAKIAYAEFVLLSDEEYARFVAEMGEAATRRCIEILDAYKGSSGKTYKSDYHAIRNWVIKRYREEAVDPKRTARIPTEEDYARGFDEP